MNKTTSKLLKLPSGRLLSYIVTGSLEDDALPFFYMHGNPCGYPVMHSLVKKCIQCNIKLVSFSRAGYGDSTRNKGRRIVDVVDDVKALADSLGVEECFVGGWSGGGPHVLACAARLQRCKGALCVAGVAPYDADGLDYFAGRGQSNIDATNAALKGEEELRKLIEPQRLRLLNADATGITKELSSILPEVDKKVLLENKDIGDNIIATLQEGLKNSSDGWVDDDLAFVDSWGFSLDEIKAPVFLYQGSEDLMVPFGHGQWLAQNIPQKHLTAHLIEGEGHYSIWVSQMDLMFREILNVSGHVDDDR